MALIKFGGGVAGISGKIGGTVYGRNKSGAYARNWAQPVNPGTVPQSVVRANMATAAASYAGLPVANIQAWASYAAVLIRYNRQGDAYTPSGRQIYIECFLNMLSIGQAPLSYPSGTITSPSINGFAITTLAGTTGLLTSLLTTIGGLVIPSGQDPADCYVQYYAAPSHPATRRNVNKQRRLVITEDGSTLAFNWFAAYNTYFGASSPDGNLIDVWARCIDTLSGFASPFSKATKVIA